MFRVAVKGLLGHKLRFFLTTLAVVLGVTFISGAFVLTDSMEGAFDDLLGTVYETADVYVRAGASFDISAAEFEAGGRPTLDERLGDDLVAIAGVADVVPGVEGPATFIDPTGEPVVSHAPSFGFNWSDTANPLTLREGREPRSAGEVTMDVSTFEAHDFELGSEVDVAAPQGITSFTLVGVTGFGDSDNLLGATIATFTIEDAQDLFDKAGQIDEFALIGDGSRDPAALRETVAAAVRDLGVDAEVTTATDRAADESAEIGEALGFLTTVLLAFAGIALFVGSFLIANTFSIIVAQRSREFALLRAVGASSRQVRTAVLFEALLVGVVASTIGLLLGIGFARLLPVLLEAAGMSLPAGGTVLAARTIVASYLVGVVVTVAASILPARRASRVAPVEAMRGAATAPSASLTRRTITGAVLAVGGGALLVVGLTGQVPQPLAVVGLGAALAFIGVSLLAPLLADPLARVLGAGPARLSVPGRIARGNARRDPRRTASTASALMIGLALVSAVSILTASVQGAVADTLNDQLRADFIVQQGGGAMPPQPMPTSVGEDLATDPAIGAVTPLRMAQASDGEDVLTLVAVDVAVVEDLIALGDTSGDLTALGARQIALLEDVATSRDLGVGDELTLTFRDGTEVAYEVAVLYATSDLVGTGYLLSLEGLAEGTTRGVDLALLASADGDLASARAAIDDAVAVAPGARVEDQAEFREAQEASIDTVLNLMLGLLLLAIIIALLGITNTLALAVIERTREIGLLRAVGMERRQTRRMVLWESVIVAGFGAVLGIAVGTFLGWAVVQALADEGVQRLVLPGGQLIAYAVVAVIAGVIAAVFPAWRASRLDVLKAVTVE
ncbi:ABC transporter permease [Nitriliruptor alkaliphilus]|uniref:ABC transporter permease n=1 Tax=Nitriliruptor alkaliphilus TaxID=427918 RepID=UPI000696B71D|nr:ABC transporter permease [Nitriliruptor alkaliphilus]